MSKIKQWLSLFLGFLVLVVMVWLFIWSLIRIAGWYEDLNDALKVAIVTAIPVVTVAVLGYFANKSLETKRAVEQAMRPKKLELYTEFNTFFMRIFSNEKVGKAPDETEIMQFFAKKTPELITFASNSVIEKWGKLRIGLDKAPSNEHKMFLVENLLKEIRTDLGHGKHGFHKGDILRLFVNDIDDHLKTENKKNSRSK